MRLCAAVFALLLVVALAGCKSRTVSPHEDIAALARAVVADVATVKLTSKGKSGAPIIVIEERHNSPIGQLQQALILARLHDHHHLRDICLEGFLKDEPSPRLGALFKAAGGNAPVRIGVAVQLVKEGEISSAEFLKLVYDDVELVPAEVREQYDVASSGKDPAGIYLQAIALQSLSQENEAALAAKIHEMEQLPDGPEKEAKKAELRELVVAADPWVKQQVDTVRGRAYASSSIEQQIAFLQGIVERASAKSVTIDEDAVEAMKKDISYLQARAAASETMVSSVAEVADRPEVAVVAMTIGAAHTARVTELLTSMGRPFAVLRLAAVDATYKATDLTEEMFERKRNRRSVYDGVLWQTLSAAFKEPGRHHPPIVLNESWLQAKAGLYLAIDRISERVLGNDRGRGEPPRPPGPPGMPGFGFDDDDFKGNIYIDPRLIRKAQDASGPVVIFAVDLNRDDHARHTRIWVKVIRSDEKVSKEESSTAEAALMDALKEAMKEESAGERRSTTLEDKLGRIRVSLHAIAVFASTEAAVKQATISG